MENFLKDSDGVLKDCGEDPSQVVDTPQVPPEKSGVRRILLDNVRQTLRALLGEAPPEVLKSKLLEAFEVTNVLDLVDALVRLDQSGRPVRSGRSWFSGTGYAARVFVDEVKASSGIAEKIPFVERHSTSLENYLHEIADRRAARHDLSEASEPKTLEIGFSDADTGEWVGCRLTLVKSARDNSIYEPSLRLGLSPRAVRTALQTPHGRSTLLGESLEEEEPVLAEADLALVWDLPEDEFGRSVPELAIPRPPR